MTETTKRRLHIIYGSVTAAVAVTVGILMMISCVKIYYGGEFTRELVTEHFLRSVAIPAYTLIALILGGFALSIAIPCPTKKEKVKRDSIAALSKLKGKVDITALPQEYSKSIHAENTKRSVHTALFYTLLGLGSAIFLFYALNVENFPKENINAEVIRAVMMLVYTLAIPLIYYVFLRYYFEKSREKEASVYKDAIRELGLVCDTVKVEEQHKFPLSLIIRILLVCTAIALVVIGLCLGGTADVIAKAVNICTECIGLG